MRCWVYVLESEATGRYYIGSAEDVHFRLGEHNAGGLAQLGERLLCTQ